jgi:cysteine-rich repeat protein
MGRPYGRRHMFLCPSPAPRLLAPLVAAALCCAPAWAQLTAPGQARLLDAAEGQAEVKVNEATGLARFVQLDGVLPGIETGAPAALKAQQFLDVYGDLFGLRAAEEELALEEVAAAPSGGVRVRYRQHHHGLPVFGAQLYVHFDKHGALRRVNGSTLALTEVPKGPALDQGAGVARALDDVRRLHGKQGAPDLVARSAELVVYQDGLLTRQLKAVHLAWIVDVTNRGNVRRTVVVDAMNGQILESINTRHDALERVTYDGQLGGYDPADPLANILWQEGDPDTGIDDVDDLHTFAEDTYTFFNNAFGRDSYDGAGAVMRSVHNLPDPSLCPNAFWNGAAAHYCDGVTPDDVVAHEWMHAYTEYTHGLIYAYEPGALNEAYSDIFGEAVDLLNADGHGAPKGPRSAGGCGAGVPSPALISVDGFGDLPGTATGYGPSLADVGAITTSAFTVRDGVDVNDDGCETLGSPQTLVGNIAVINATNFLCWPSVPLLAAEAAGAVAAIIVVPDGIGGPFDLGPGADSSTIPSLLVPASSGGPLVDFLVSGPASITLSPPTAATETSARWQVGEGATAFGGAIRDMFNPGCHGHPATTSDPLFYCGPFDGGGVHLNSGVPNHAFALLVDGGTTGGVTVPAIGLIRAVHIYYVAMTQYQTEVAGFADHADALAASCDDLLSAGTDLLDPATGQPSGLTISAADCAAVDAAIDATGLDAPTPCVWPEQMNPDAPALTCDGGRTLTAMFSDDFESDPSGTWQVEEQSGLDLLYGRGAGEAAGYMPVDFTWVTDLPDDRPGGAYFARNLPSGNCADVNQSSVMYLRSPVVTLDEQVTSPMLTFSHWFSIEPGWDGANVALSVNGGDFELVGQDRFVFNGYTSFITGGTDNPLAGQPAFSGFEDGTLQGRWAESQIDLDGLASPGDEVQVRFQLGVDGCYGFVGWYVDDVAVRGCAPACGDGQLVADETCDDGNDVDDGNGCSATCQRNDVCGDGIHQALYEACDDGNTDNGDACVDGCTLASCGDGYLHAGVEACDDGNTTDDGDGCSATCQRNDVCGDGVVQDLYEQCDDGNTDDDGNGCSATCQRNDTCGDGVVQDLYEQCDDGDTDDDANGCSATCQRNATCGDGVVQDLYEQCDDGNADDDGNGCSATCQRNGTCGDGVVQDLYEQCDDGDTDDSGNGCSAACQRNDTCGDGVVQDLYEQCDDGDADDERQRLLRRLPPQRCLRRRRCSGPLRAVRRRQRRRQRQRLLRRLPAQRCLRRRRRPGPLRAVRRRQHHRRRRLCLPGARARLGLRDRRDPVRPGVRRWRPRRQRGLRRRQHHQRRRLQRHLRQRRGLRQRCHRRRRGLRRRQHHRRRRLRQRLRGGGRRRPDERRPRRRGPGQRRPGERGPGQRRPRRRGPDGGSARRRLQRDTPERRRSAGGGTGPGAAWTAVRPPPARRVNDKGQRRSPLALLRSRGRRAYLPTLRSRSFLEALSTPPASNVSAVTVSSSPKTPPDFIR